MAKRRPIQHYGLRDRTTASAAEWLGVEGMQAVAVAEPAAEDAAAVEEVVAHLQQHQQPRVRKKDCV